MFFRYCMFAMHAIMWKNCTSYNNEYYFFIINIYSYKLPLVLSEWVA